jgi:hypothetical protein
VGCPAAGKREKGNRRKMVKTLIHKSQLHLDGFDVNCPQCLEDEGISGIINHLTKCAKGNQRSAEQNSTAGCVRATAAALAVADEQRRMIGVLKFYKRICVGKPVK